MGWSGTYYGKNMPKKGRERIEAVIRDAGMEWETPERKYEVIDTASHSTTCYFAVKRTDKTTGKTFVFATVALTRANGGYFMIKIMDETSGPYAYDCPQHILDKLSTPANDWSAEWSFVRGVPHIGESSVSLICTMSILPRANVSTSVADGMRISLAASGQASASVCSQKTV